MHRGLMQVWGFNWGVQQTCEWVSDSTREGRK